MNIQSAGRLGNQLFIFGHALNLILNLRVKSVNIFADKYHSKIDEELVETFRLLSGNGINFTINNRLGFLLKVMDKLTRYSTKLSKQIRRTLRIETEGEDEFSSDAWIQRGFFQEKKLPENVLLQMSDILRIVLHASGIQESVKIKFPILCGKYQAVHIRRTDFFTTDFGVINPISQLDCLRDDLAAVICTDAKKEDLSRIFDVTNFEIITSKESTAWEALTILSNAESLIMSNSTLSYWAGFIASKSGRKVCAPSTWSKRSTVRKQLPFTPHVTYNPIFEEL